MQLNGITLNAQLKHSSKKIGRKLQASQPVGLDKVDKGQRVISLQNLQ